MKKHFELYILTEHLMPAHWTKLYRSLLQYLGAFSTFEISFRCTDNVVRFFISSDKDLGSLSNNLEGILLRPVHANELVPPPASSKDRFVQFVTGGNLLDLKEKTAVKKSKDLQFAVFKVRAINSDKALVRGNLFFKSAAGTWTMASKTKTTRTQPTEQDIESDNRSLQATVVSMFTKIIDADTRITYALLKSEKETLYAAWRNSYLARDIMVHRKYTFNGRVVSSKNNSYLTDPTFIDVPVINKYFEFALVPPSEQKQPRSFAAKAAISLVTVAVIAGVLTAAFNSHTFEQALAGRSQEVSFKTD